MLQDWVGDFVCTESFCVRKRGWADKGGQCENTTADSYVLRSVDSGTGKPKKPG